MIGKKVWLFDENRRRYRKDESGRSLGGPPIWREHWYQVEITGETSRSWIIKNVGKIPKRDGRGIAFSEDEINKASFVHDNRHKIAELVRNLQYDQLKKVADIIGYEEF